MITRREMIKLTTSSLVGLGLGSIPFFPGKGWAMPVVGEMVVIPGTPNPNGGFDQLYWCACDASSAPINRITVAGNKLPAQTENRAQMLRILHFNDLHNHITLPHKKKGDTHRFSQMFKIIEKRKSEKKTNEALLILSGGDDHTGSIFDELIGWNVSEYAIDPAYAVYSAAGLDAAALGNHELDRGTRVLQQGIRDAARFPVLSANLKGSRYLKSGEDYFPAAIGVVNGLRVGLIGLTTPVDTHTKTREDPNLDVGSPVQAIKNLAPILSKQVDCLVVLSHCGYGLDNSRSGKAGADRFLGEGDKIIAKALNETADCPSIIVGGHTHTALNRNKLEPENKVGNVAILQAGGHGKYLGEATLDFNQNKVSAKLHSTKKRDERVKKGDAKYKGLEHDEDYASDFEVKQISPLLKKVQRRLEMVIAQVKGNPDTATDSVISARYTGELALANFMNDALVTRSTTFPGGGIDFALFNATGFSSGIPVQGPLTFMDWYNVMPFADSVVIATVTGRQIGDILINNAKRIVRPDELTGSSSLNLEGYISRGFLHFSKGIRYKVKLNRSASTATAVDISILGKPLEDVITKKFRLGMNSYIAAGGYGESWNMNPIGGGVSGHIIGYDLKKLEKLDTGLVYRNEVIAHIKNSGEISPRKGCIVDGRLKVIA